MAKAATEHDMDGRNSEDLAAALGDHGLIGGRTALGAGLGIVTRAPESRAPR